MKNLSITARMLIVALAPAILVTCLLTLWSFVDGVREVERSEMRRARTLAESLSQASGFAVASGNTALLDEIARPTLAIPSITSVRFTDEQGRLLRQLIDDTPRHAGDDASQIARLWLRLLITSSLASIEQPIVTADLSDFDDPLFAPTASDPVVMSAPWPPEGRRLGTLHLTTDLTAAYHRQLDSASQGLTVTLLILLAAAPAAVALARSVSRPVRVVTEAMTRLERHEYIEQVPIRTGGELGELAQGVLRLSAELNSFHARLQDSARLATDDLHLALDALETRNRELDEARATAETASAFKSEFLANMSHEIRTPMNTVIGTLSTLNRSPLDSDQAEQVALINSASTSLLELIDDILDITKIETGNLRTESVPFALADVLKEVFEGTSAQAVERGIELCVVVPPPDTPDIVMGDPLRLKQVLFNLVSNAIKFAEHGHVLLDVERVSGTAANCLLNLSVVDTGIGIPVHLQSALFDAFAQADMSSTRHHGGVGLGLHICRGIVELLGGDIRLESEPGKGSRFTVSLPFKIAPSPVVHRPDDRRKPTFRYVDDYLPLLATSRLILERGGAQLTVADSSSPVPESPLPPALVAIPNRTLSAIDKRVPHDFQPPAIDGRLIALVSRTTTDIRSWLTANGFDAHVIRTPHPVELKRRLIAAYEHQDFLLAGAPKVPAQGVEIPLRQSRREASSGVTSGRARPIDVLAVDDQRMNLDLLARYFTHLDVHGHFARTDVEALGLLDARRFDMVLLDLHMPGRDGFEIVTALRGSNMPNRLTPIIALTADAYADSRERALQCGFDAVLTKPVTLEQVRVELARWMPAPAHMVSIDACAAGMLDNHEWAVGAIATYRDEVSDHVNRIRAACATDDAIALQEVAHALKGVSDVCRVTAVADAARSLEQASESGDRKRSGLLAERLVELLQMAARQCDAELERVAALA